MDLARRPKAKILLMNINSGDNSYKFHKILHAIVL